MELAGIPLVCEQHDIGKPIRLETKIYDHVNRRMSSSGWRYQRIDTTDQRGFPDLFLTKGDQYIQAEAKLQKVKTLRSLKQLSWEPGQLAYALKSFLNKEPYLILTGLDTTLTFIYGGYIGTLNYTHITKFIRLCGELPAQLAKKG